MSATKKKKEMVYLIQEGDEVMVQTIQQVGIYQKGCQLKVSRATALSWIGEGLAVEDCGKDPEEGVVHEED